MRALLLLPAIKINLSRYCFTQALLISLLFFSGIGKAHAQWPVNLVTGGSQVTDSAVDSQGNHYLTGHYVGNMQFPREGQEAAVLAFDTSSQSSQYFIVKYNKVGTFIWAKQILGYGPDRNPARLSIDNKNRVYFSNYGSGVNRRGNIGDSVVTRAVFKTELDVFNADGVRLSHSSSDLYQIDAPFSDTDLIHPTGNVQFSLSESIDNAGNQTGFQLMTFKNRPIGGSASDDWDSTRVRQYHWQGDTLIWGDYKTIPVNQFTSTARVLSIEGLLGDRYCLLISAGTPNNIKHQCFYRTNLDLWKIAADGDGESIAFLGSLASPRILELDIPANSNPLMAHWDGGIYYYNRELLSYTHPGDPSRNFSQKIVGGAVLSNDLTVDSAGNAIISGRTANKLTFTNVGGDPVTLSFDSSSAESSFVAKISNSGEWAWANNVARTSKTMSGNSLAVNRDGSVVYLGASYVRTAAFAGSKPPIEFSGSPAFSTYIMPLETTSGKWLNPTPITVGQSISRPVDALAGKPPLVYVDNILINALETDYVYWSEVDDALYVVGDLPGNTQLAWRTVESGETDDEGSPIGSIFGATIAEPIINQPSEQISIHAAGTSVDLLPAYTPNNFVNSANNNNEANRPLRFERVVWPSELNLAFENNVFTRDEWEGVESDYVVLQYNYTSPTTNTAHPYFQMVETKKTSDFIKAGSNCVIGEALTENSHARPAERNGHVVNVRSRYDASLHNRASDLGSIIAVNTAAAAADTKMDVVWYGINELGQFWSNNPRRYNCQWKDSADVITISDQQGSGDLSDILGPNVRNPSIYYQNDVSLPGFNANEEHALLYNNRVYALRDDLNEKLNQQNPEMYSLPRVLLKYEDGDNANKTTFKQFKITAVADDKPFGPKDANKIYQSKGLYKTTVGNLLQAPAPLTRLGVDGCDGTTIVDSFNVGWTDHQNNFWGRSAGIIKVKYQYPLQDGFYFDFDDNVVVEGTKEVGECVSWLAYHSFAEGGATDDAISIKVLFEWPENAPIMAPGETLFKSKIVECADPNTDEICTLPQINGQAAAEIIYDEVMHGADAPLDADPADALLTLFDPLSARSVALEKLPPAIATFSQGGVELFTGLPFVLRSRLSYDPINKLLSFKGTFDDSQIGDPHLLANIMTAKEKDRILALSNNTDFATAVTALYHKSRNPNDLELATVLIGGVVVNAGVPGEADQAYLIGLQGTYLGDGLDTDDDGIANDFIDESSYNDTGELILNPNFIDDRLDSPTFSLQSGHSIVKKIDKTAAQPQALTGVPMALAAGRTRGEGWVTLAFNNDPELGLPVSLQVIKVDASKGVYQGNIWIVPSDNVFDESLTLRHSADFAGDPDRIDFSWYYQPDTAGQPEAPLSFAAGDTDKTTLLPVDSPWIRHGSSGLGAIDITIEGPGLLTLSDNWFITRYTGLGTDSVDTDVDLFGNKDIPSPWAGDPSYNRYAETSNPAVETKGMLAEGWIKRVIGKLNVFDQRVSDFHTSEVNTLTSIIAQAGEPYAGPIPFNPDPDVINNVGIIEAYQTVLDRGKDLSIGAGFNDIAANTQLLNASTRIADLYMLLGNEAYADAQDPTIGFDTHNKIGSVGSIASSMFAFQNQLASPLEEELILLRGRDDSRSGTSGHPVNNRLFWNFTQGNGEVAYVKNYRITDQNADGFVNETDARILYPQGHGDAWGHYLTSVKNRYLLLKEENFTWKPRTESVLVAGVPIEIDYLDERKFAAAAAAKARAGVEVINLTYREKYVESPAGQWQGYKDTKKVNVTNESGDVSQIDRAWGLDGWGRRAAQGAYFDWLTANAILPHEDPDPTHEGIEKVDRTTVPELGEIAAAYNAIQAQLDKADAGLNPLGLAKGVVPFDINPNTLEGEMGNHFDQIAGRAQAALDNALKVFDHANQQTKSLRYVQDNVDQITTNMAEQERDYKNRLIELFGYPYAGDIGGGKTYPSGYNGPDLYHYQYINSDLVGDLPAPNGSFTGYFTGIPFGGVNAHFFPEDLTAFTNVGEDILEVYYPVTEGAGATHGGSWKFIAPTSWGKRRAPGELQNSLSALLQAEAESKMALKAHENLLEDIEDAADLLEAEYQLNIVSISILKDEKYQAEAFSKTIWKVRNAQSAAGFTATTSEYIAQIIELAIADTVGLATDALAPITSTSVAIALGVATVSNEI